MCKWRQNQHLPFKGGSQVSLCWKGQNLFVYGQEYVPFLSVTYNSQNWKTEFKNSGLDKACVSTKPQIQCVLLERDSTNSCYLRQ